MKKSIWIIVIIVIFCAGAAAWYAGRKNDAGSSGETPSGQTGLPEQSAAGEQTFIAQAVYACDGGKTVTASFYEGEPIFVEPGQMPIPAGNVKIVLDDGRNFDLPQTISASGVRYANEDESFIFWNKGDAVMIFENGEEKNYTNCAAPAAGGDQAEINQ